jgi:excisionase family DNA binding protein
VRCLEVDNFVTEFVKRIVENSIKDLIDKAGRELLTPDELADRLKVPVTWVYEQSRKGIIPTHKIGRYIRFDLQEVIDSQKRKVKH